MKDVFSIITELIKQRQFTFADMERDTNNVAANLISLGLFLNHDSRFCVIVVSFLKTGKGLNRGDRIGMYAVNHYEWIVTQLAAAKAGLILGKDTQNHKWLLSRAIMA